MGLRPRWLKQKLIPSLLHNLNFLNRLSQYRMFCAMKNFEQPGSIKIFFSEKTILVLIGTIFWLFPLYFYRWWKRNWDQVNNQLTRNSIIYRFSKITVRRTRIQTLKNYKYVTDFLVHIWVFDSRPWLFCQNFDKNLPKQCNWVHLCPLCLKLQVFWLDHNRGIILPQLLFAKITGPIPNLWHQVKKKERTNY